MQCWLRRCVDSILAQTFTDFELLLIDDGSKDRSGAICDEYALADPRVRVFHKPNGGVSSARNLGLDNARGEWISFVDADDWIESSLFSDSLQIAIKERADIVTFDFAFVYSDGRKILHNTFNWEEQGAKGVAKYIEQLWTIVWNNLIRTDLFIQNDIYFPEQISFTEDFHVMSRLLATANKIIKLNKPLYNYYQSESSAIHNLNEKADADAIWVLSDLNKFF